MADEENNTPAQRVTINGNKILDIINEIEDVNEQLFTISSVLLAIVNAHELSVVALLGAFTELFASERQRNPLDLVQELAKEILDHALKAGDPKAKAILAEAQAADRAAQAQAQPRMVVGRRFRREFRRRG